MFFLQAIAKVDRERRSSPGSSRTSTRPAAAALWWNAASRPRDPVEHLDRQHGERRHAASRTSTNGGSAVTGDAGRNAMKVSAPIVMSGAVSPMARDMPMMTPVRMPAQRIRQDVVRRRLPLGRARARRRPRGSICGIDADRLARRDDDDRQDQQRQRQPRGQDALPEPELVDEEAQRQQAVDDRRHAGEVGDVDLDEVGQPVLAARTPRGRRPPRRRAARPTTAVTSITSVDPDPGREDARLVRHGATGKR